MRYLLLVWIIVPWTVNAQVDTQDVFRRETIIFVGPDSSGMARLKDEQGEEGFYVAADDEMFYRSHAYALLDSLGMSYTFVERRPLKFEVGGEVREYAWPDVPDGWFVVIYVPGTEPRITYSVALPDEIGAAGAN